MDFKSKIFLIYGPTASGKSEFAVRLAKKLKGEIINADSMQVYRDFKILTARPLKKDFKKIKHHLYGFHNANKNFSAGDWLKMASKKIFEIKNKKKTPILVGGTGLYYKALVDGLVEFPKIPLGFRNKVRKLHKDLGQDRFYKKLVQTDPHIINQIKSTDVQRSIRAYEIKTYTNKSLVEWYKNTNTKFKKGDFYKIIIDFPRPELVEKIKIRTAKIIDSGAILEVKKFLKLKIPKDKSISKAIGICEIDQYLKKKIDRKNLIEKISIKTRQYAKRQMTWTRGHMTSWKKIKSTGLNNFLKKI